MRSMSNKGITPLLLVVQFWTRTGSIPVVGTIISFYMAYFIEFTSIHNHPVLMNVDSIAYIEPYDDGSRIHVSVCRISSSEGSGSIRSVNGSSEIVYVKESYQVVKRKINEL